MFWSFISLIPMGVFIGLLFVSHVLKKFQRGYLYSFISVCLVVDLILVFVFPNLPIYKRIWKNKIFQCFLFWSSLFLSGVPSYISIEDTQSVWPIYALMVWGLSLEFVLEVKTAGVILNTTLCVSFSVGLSLFKANVNGIHTWLLIIVLPCVFQIIFQFFLPVNPIPGVFQLRINADKTDLDEAATYSLVRIEDFNGEDRNRRLRIQPHGEGALPPTTNLEEYKLAAVSSSDDSGVQEFKISKWEPLPKWSSLVQSWRAKRQNVQARAAARSIVEAVN